ncbi:MAG TPA: phage holin [Candidatus Scatavimonas merdigallinarum]|uniref:Phage holin n=1 Tax=Candidatus Scatavimonas merdigallinarum TaxID=2840914 RepID=A0A9D1CUF0_9FIRM|nr:phage holin [Candidatus Scatavimonas merdigallinarum]
MNINWKVRLRSGPFWLGLISLVLTLVYTLFNMAGVIPAFDQKEILDIAVMLLQILAFVGVVSDPTTKGVSDSAQAMTYEKPVK